MFRYVLRCVFALIISLGLMSTGIATANADAGNHVTLSSVSCVDGQGTVTVSMTADSTIGQSTEFIITVDDQQFGSAVTVAPGATETKTVPNLDDGIRHIVVMAGEVYELDQSPKVQCDNVPVGNYTNPDGSVTPFCNRMVEVKASNYPIGDNLVGLQPVTFTATFVANDSGVVQTLDTFTLPSGDDDAFDTVRYYTLAGAGVVSLYADGMKPVHLYFTDGCITVPDVVKHHKPRHHHKKHHHHKPSKLPNTGK